MKNKTTHVYTVVQVVNASNIYLKTFLDKKKAKALFKEIIYTIHEDAQFSEGQLANILKNEFYQCDQGDRYYEIQKTPLR